MADLPIDSKAAYAYRKMDADWAAKTGKPPMFAGMDDDKVIFMAKKLDPNFSDRYNSLYQNASPIAKTVQTVGDAAGKAVSTTADALNSIPVYLNPLGVAAAKVGKDINDAVEPIIDQSPVKNLAIDLGLDRPLPETQAGVIGQSLLFALTGIEKPANNVDPIKVGTRNVTSVDPATGLIKRLPVPDAEALAKSDYISTPEAHGALAQSHVESLMKASEHRKNNEWDKLSDLVGTNGQLSNYPIDISDAARIAADAPGELLAHPDFQTAGIKKMRQIGSAATDMNSADAPEAATTSADWHDLEPVGTQMSAQEVVQMRKSLNKIYSSNYKNPTGHLAGEIIDSLDKSFQKDAPDILKEQHEKTMSASSDFYNTYMNKTVQKFLESSPEKAHTLATKDLASQNLVRNAGGEVALEHLRRSAAYHLYSDIVNKGMTANDVLARFRTDRALDSLFTDDQVSRFANIANSRLAAIQAQIEGEQVGLGSKMLSAGKKALSSATGGAVGGILGGVPGAVTGASAAAGLSDIIGK